MRKVEDYKRHADECRKMASSSSDEEGRQGLLQMAETWEALANDRQEQIARQRRIADLEKQQD